MEEARKTELIDAALSGDIESYGRLCRMYYSAMVAVAYAVLGDHHLAEDAAQETFAKALSKLAKLKNKEKFVCWLSRICRNTAMDIVRNKIRRRKTEEAKEVCKNDYLQDDHEAVIQAIKRLSHSERELVILRYYDNLSLEKVSEVLGLSKAAVNNKLCRARRRLAAYLEREGFEGVVI